MPAIPHMPLALARRWIEAIDAIAQRRDRRRRCQRRELPPRLMTLSRSWPGTSFRCRRVLRACVCRKDSDGAAGHTANLSKAGATELRGNWPWYLPLCLRLHVPRVAAEVRKCCLWVGRYPLWGDPEIADTLGESSACAVLLATRDSRLLTV
jgi:hypothetical protein